MQDSVVTLAFVFFLLASTAVKFWLSTRQMRHVTEHREQVPAAFADSVTADAHRRAADYTVAKGRFGLLTMAFGAAISPAGPDPITSTSQKAKAFS